MEENRDNPLIDNTPGKFGRFRNNPGQIEFQIKKPRHDGNGNDIRCFLPIKGARMVLTPQHYDFLRKLAQSDPLFLKIMAEFNGRIIEID